MSDYRNDDENKELTSQTVTDDHKTEDKREDEYEKYCYLCRRPESVAGKLIDMPGNIHICADCMQKTFDNLNPRMHDCAHLRQQFLRQVLGRFRIAQFVHHRQRDFSAGSFNSTIQGNVHQHAVNRCHQCLTQDSDQKAE